MVVGWTLFAKGPGSNGGFPTPLETVEAAWKMVGTGPYWSAIASTVITTLAGFAITLVIGIPVGLLVGSYHRLQLSTQFIVDFGRTIPGTAIIPILLLQFGNTRTMAIMLVIFGAVWPMIVQTTYAAQQMTPQMRQVARAFRLKPIDRFRFIFAPSALPFLMTGLRVSASISLILTVTAEYLGQSGGIGLSLFQMHEVNMNSQLFVYMFTAGILGVLLNFLLIAVQHRVLWWHPSERERATR